MLYLYNNREAKLHVILRVNLTVVLLCIREQEN